ncbi:Transmembrane protein 115 [Rhynchospora pubera]|uniref:Transmembrane protein 115 n=1 Tax=Rhynchospora pubera TaxID=906938 RepID=A0AAV8BVU8_9POAL|nr:Transmembrane protein 115 [Rhynchospora pubera]
MMEDTAPSSDHPSSTPVVTPGKGFTKTCKGGVVVLIGGYALLQLIPGSINYLAIIPAKTIPFVWTLFTAGYIEQVLPGAIGNSLGLLFCGKDIEPVWGRKELLKFIILVNFISSILAFVIAVALYYITGKESFLTTPLSGFHGVLAAFLVALKQLLPNLELPMCFFWKIKAKWMPLFVMTFSTVMAFIVVESINFLPTLLAGTYVGWIYLRYFQKNPLTGLKGDPSDDFSFASFFPDFMRPVTEPVANTFDKLCCARSRAGHQALPVSDPSKASRRRYLFLFFYYVKSLLCSFFLCNEHNRFHICNHPELYLVIFWYHRTVDSDFNSVITLWLAI